MAILKLKTAFWTSASTLRLVVVLFHDSTPKQCHVAQMFVFCRGIGQIRRNYGICSLGSARQAAGQHFQRIDARQMTSSFTSEGHGKVVTIAMERRIPSRKYKGLNLLLQSAADYVHALRDIIFFRWGKVFSFPGCNKTPLWCPHVSPQRRNNEVLDSAQIQGTLKARYEEGRLVGSAKVPEDFAGNSETPPNHPSTK